MAAAIITAVLIWAIAGIYWSGGSATTPAEVTIPEGSGVSAIAQQLHDMGLIDSVFLFKVYTAVLGDARGLQAGTFTIEPSMSIADIGTQLSSGGADANEVRITIVEGWTSQEIEEALLEAGFNAADFAESVQTIDLDWEALAGEEAAYLFEGRSKKRGYEGYLFPDTYQFFKDTGSKEIIASLVKNYVAKVHSAELKALASESNLTPYEALTLASVIEKEMRTPEDRRTAAGIFLQRLADSYPLESDATVNYVTGKNTTRPSFSDLEVESAYNTYKNTGLPPTPISNPGRDAILSVFEPTQTDYYFFLHTPDGDTIFTSTFEEHLEQKAIYYN